MTEVAPSFEKVGPESSSVGVKPSHLVAAVTTKMAQQNHLPDGTSRLGVSPKPVEVMSVPETPVNGGQTPAGGTPRPELKLTNDDAPEHKEPPQEAPVILGPNTEKKAVAPEPVSDVGGPDHGSPSNPAIEEPPTGESAPVGEKRKVEHADAEPMAVETESQDDLLSEKKEERPEKKAKTTDQMTGTVVDSKDSVDAKGNADAKKKPGRPKKDKSAPVPVGKTQRKTRSQGPIE